MHLAVLDSTSTLAGTSGRSAQDCYCARGAVGGAKKWRGNGEDYRQVGAKKWRGNGEEHRQVIVIVVLRVVTHVVPYQLC